MENKDIKYSFELRKSSSKKSHSVRATHRPTGLSVYRNKLKTRYLNQIAAREALIELVGYYNKELI
jgi:hypothetical protein